MTEETGYPLEEIKVLDAILDIHEDYDSLEDLGNKLASENVDQFKILAYDKDRDKMSTITFDLLEAGFDANDIRPNINCYKMKVYDKCDKYMLTLLPYKATLHYDNDQDRENILKAIQAVKQVDLPIEKIKINSIEVPEDRDHENQEDNTNQVIESKVEITNLDTIQAEEDIIFEY